MNRGTRPTDEDYRRLLHLRDGLRRFLKWSGGQARQAGLTPGQHQLLLVIRGHDDPAGPTVGDIAGHLLVRHHSAVELVDRCVAGGLVERTPDAVDQRVVRVRLTEAGEGSLESLSELHLGELRRLASTLAPIWADLGTPTPD